MKVDSICGLSTEKVHESWISILERIFRYQKNEDLRWFLNSYKRNDYQKIYPGNSANVLAPFCMPVEDVRVIMVCGYPYFQDDMNTGYPFGYRGLMPKDIMILHEEVYRDMQETKGYVSAENWQKQGVLLMHAVPMRGKNLGSGIIRMWQNYTQQIISNICKDAEHSIVVMLIGAFSRPLKPSIPRGVFIDWNKRQIPDNISERRQNKFSNPFIIVDSPLEEKMNPSSRHFKGTGVFSLTNQLLISTGQEPIEWIKF